MVENKDPKYKMVDKKHFHVEGESYGKKKVAIPKAESKPEKKSES